MRRIVTEVTEKRPRLVGGDEPHRLISEHVGDVALCRFVLRTAEEYRIEVVIPMTLVESEELIKALPLRRERILLAIVPFADARRSIARRMQRLGDRHLCGAHRLAIVGDPMAARAQRPTPR